MLQGRPTCASCGTTRRSRDRFCRRCGAKLPSSSYPPPPLRSAVGTVAGFPRPQLGQPSEQSPPAAEGAPSVARMATVIGIGSRRPDASSDSGQPAAVRIEAPTFTRRPSPPPAALDGGDRGSDKGSTLRPPAAPDTEHVTVIRLPGAAGARFTQPPDRAAKAGPGSDPPGSDRPRSDPPRSDPSRSDPPGSDRPRSDPPRSDPPRSDPPRSDPPHAQRSSDEPRPLVDAREAPSAGRPASAPTSDRPVASASDPGAASPRAGESDAPAPKLAGWKERRLRGIAAPGAASADDAREPAERAGPAPEPVPEAARSEASAPPTSRARGRRRLEGVHGLSSKRLALYVVLFLLTMTGTTIGLTLLLL